MTYEEAIIEITKQYDYYNMFEDYKKLPLTKALHLAIEALQKQVPMKPKAEDFGWTVRENCPVCDDSVDCGEIYCSYCGQRILWDDEE